MAISLSKRAVELLKLSYKPLQVKRVWFKVVWCVKGYGGCFFVFPFYFLNFVFPVFGKCIVASVYIKHLCFYIVMLLHRKGRREQMSEKEIKKHQGRKNDSKVDYWLTEDGLILLEGWARNSTTKTEIADRIGITLSTLLKWCDKYEEINRAVNSTREVVDFMVENALLKAALGYRTTEIKVTVGKKVINGETVEMLKETTTKDVPPNVNAATLWLNNRKFDDWKRNRDKVVEVDPDDQQVTITIQRGNKQRITVESDETVTDDGIDVDEEESDTYVDDEGVVDENGDIINSSVTYTAKQLKDAEDGFDDENEENDDEWDDWDEDEADLDE